MVSIMILKFVKDKYAIKFVTTVLGHPTHYVMLVILVQVLLDDTREFRGTRMAILFE